MKIAYVYDLIYPYSKGGAEKRFWELARILASRGHEVHMYGLKLWPGENSFLKDNVRIHGVASPSPYYLRTGIRDIKQVLRFSFRIYLALRLEKFDIVDCNAFVYLPFFPVKLLSLTNKFSLVVTWQEVWGAYWYKYLGRVKGVIGRLAEKLVINFADRIILHSHIVRRKLLEYGAREDRLKLIPNGIDFKLIQGLTPAQESSDMIFAGRLIEHKHVDIFLRSLYWVKKDFPSVKGVIIGEGQQKAGLLRLIRELDLAQSVKCYDFMLYEQMLSLLKASKIFVFPSTREGFGIAVLEAMACGLPVIAVSDPMNASVELVQEGRTGGLCLLNEKVIARKVIEFLNDENSRRRMSCSAKEYACKFDWEVVAGLNESFYQSVIARKMHTGGVS